MKRAQENAASEKKTSPLRRFARKCGVLAEQACKKGGRTLGAFLQSTVIKRKGSVCIGGYAGCGNLGDDAVLQGILSSFPPHFDRSRITVLSGSPKTDRRRFGVACIHRKNPVAVLLVLARSEEFRCGGGSLLQNATGNLSLLYYLLLLRAAVALGCRTSLIGSGIGPLHGAWAQAETVRALNRCALVEVRDADSHRLLFSWGVKKELLRLVADPALSLVPPPLARRQFLLLEHHIPQDRSYFCVILQPPRADAATLSQILSGALRILAKQQELLPIFLVFDPTHDALFSQTVQKKCGGRSLRLREPRDALALLSGAKFALSMRLHGLILSESVSTPALGISPDPHDPKLSSFCRTAGFPHLPLSSLSIVTLADALKMLLG